MDKKKRTMISVAVGVISFLSLIGYLQVQRQQLLQEGNMVPVLVAKQDIPVYTPLEETLIEQTLVPKKYLQPGALGNYRDAVGQVVSTAMMKGEQILGTKLVTFGSELGLSSKLAPGVRAVSISVDDVSGVAKLVTPNDFVDLLATFDFGDQAQSQKYTYTLFENIQVLAVNKDLGGAYAALGAKGEDGKVMNKLINASGIAGSSVTYTLAFTPDEAQRLVLAQETGKLTVSLRPRGETESKLALPPVTPTDLTGLKGLLKQSKPTYMEYRGGGL